MSLEHKLPPYRLVTLGRLTLLRPDGSDEPTLRTQTRKLALLAYLAHAARPLRRRRAAAPRRHAGQPGDAGVPCHPRQHPHAPGRCARGDARIRERQPARDAAASRDVSIRVPPRRSARIRLGTALLGDALYTAGAVDTARLVALADSIEAIGGRSYFARDWTLHHHLRGLVAMQGGRWAAAERELQSARFGPAGWTRTVVELASAQRAQGRTRDAVATLRDAYVGSVDGPGRYAPRSEIDFEMARAMAAAGMTDSARVYADYVRRAWRDADPAVRARLAALAR